MIDLIALAERCEKAEGPDRDIDRALCPLVGIRVVDEGRPLGRCYYDAHGHGVPLPLFTTSIDAVLSLIDPADEWSLSTIYNIARAEVGINRDQQTAWTGYGENASCIPVLALLAAALKARALAGDRP